MSYRTHPTSVNSKTDVSIFLRAAAIAHMNNWNENDSITHETEPTNKRREYGEILKNRNLTTIDVRLHRIHECTKNG